VKSNVEAFKLKKFYITAALASLFLSTDVYAWFFFIPGSATRAIGDSITGAKGDICVKESYKVGDTINSTTGNIGTIKSLSGKSSICNNPATPIRAEVEFQFNFQTKSAISLPDDYEVKQPTELQKFNGQVLSANAKGKRNTGVVINARKKDSNSDPAAVASAYEKSHLNFLLDAESKNPEQLTINGLKAWRFEVNGKLKGVFGQQLTYLITVIEGDSEILSLISFTPTQNYAEEKATLLKIVEDIKGLGEEQRSVSPPTSEINTLQKNSTPPSASSTTEKSTSTTKTPTEKLRDLSQMFKEGLINENEFEAKKKEILKSF
jgi:hypothetical protein